MTYEVVIGVEVHAQLRTQSKMFCACGTMFGLTANSQTCPVCLGLPGTFAGHQSNGGGDGGACRAGVELHDRGDNRFARKNYFYPDLPKGIRSRNTSADLRAWVD